MENKSFKHIPFNLCSILATLFLSYTLATAGQVVITPDKTESPTFHTSTATCYGTNANTYINLGFGTSVTGTDAWNAYGCVVGGGRDNTASSDYATVSGGLDNTASGYCTIVGGGRENEASSSYATIGGGKDNTVSGIYATVGGGLENGANGYATVAGGQKNIASGGEAAIGGGHNNKATGQDSTIGGGDSNTASGLCATIGGGFVNTADGDYSWAGGRYMKLEDTADNTFVWGYSDTEESISTANAFLIFPAGTAGKVGIGTPNPGSKLHVKGNDYPESFLFLDTNGVNQDSGIRFYENGVVKGHLYHKAQENTLIFDYDGVSNQLTLNLNGNVGIGTKIPQYKLDVIGDARVTGNIYYGGSSGNPGTNDYNKPDYVFEEGYEVMSTEQVAKHLQKENSLPWITSQKQEQEENGAMVDMTRMSFETVETVENLQVQIIALSKTNKNQQKTIEDQQKAINQLRADVEALRTMMSN